MQSAHVHYQTQLEDGFELDGITDELLGEVRRPAASEDAPGILQHVLSGPSYTHGASRHGVLPSWLGLLWPARNGEMPRGAIGLSHAFRPLRLLTRPTTRASGCATAFRRRPAAGAHSIGLQNGSSAAHRGAASSSCTAIAALPNRRPRDCARG